MSPRTPGSVSARSNLPRKQLATVSLRTRWKDVDRCIQKTVIQSQAQRQAALREQVIEILNLENKQLLAEVEEREITLGRQNVRILELENR